MVKQAGKKSAKGIFAFFRWRSNSDDEKKVQTANIKEETQEQVAPKRKISSKHSLTTPPFEANLNWDTGRLFMPEDEHSDAGKVNIQVPYGDTFINQQQQSMHKKSEIIEKEITVNVDRKVTCPTTGNLQLMNNISSKELCIE